MTHGAPGRACDRPTKRGKALSDSEIISVVVTTVIPVNRGRIIALAEVELTIHGIAFELHGVVVARIRCGITGRDAAGVFLPQSRGQDGAWKPAVTLPPELERPIADAVLGRAHEVGIIKAADINIPASSPPAP